MSNYKIRVANKGDIKEAQELFFELGYKWACGEKQNPAINECPTIIRSHDSGCMTWSISSEPLYGDHKEITIPELRDLVVLKRNDRNDRTHTDQDNWSWFISSNGTGYVFGAGNANGLHQWDESSLNMVDLKPIEKTMKEYLRKNNDGEYILEVTNEREAQEPHAKHWIEVPKGCDYLISVFGVNSFIDSDMFAKFKTKNVLWSRHTHPEELPFIDDEPSLGNSKIGRRAITVKIPVESLNSQYAEIEKVRQSAWQKQEGGSHYKNLKIQPMQYALENKLDYAQSNVVKYVTRHKEKNGKEDLLKAIHNLELMIEFYYGDEK